MWVRFLLGPYQICKMKEKHTKAWMIIASLIIIMIAGQIFSFYLIYRNSNENQRAIKELENKTAEKISTLDKDLQSKINSLADSITSSINSLMSSQDLLSKQISEVKAKTSSDFSGIIEQEIKGVVTIKTDVAQGTGFLITDDGYIVTNEHVLSEGHFANVYTYDGGKYSAELIGYQPVMDIALLKIDGSFSKLTLGNSDDTKIGEKVIAIGNPLGLSFTATEGIISARDREGLNSLPYYFQTDVSLNPGNSGGPLISTNGEVIGINNFKISTAENIGFALESNYIKKAVNGISMKGLNMTLV